MESVMISQVVQLKAILGRFDGNRAAAFIYCQTIANDYPKLAEEYQAYADKVLKEI
jgi:hypothetical protein